MKGYFVVVKAKVWNTGMGEEYEDIKLFKIDNLADLGEQLDAEYGNEIMDFSVIWIGGQNIGLNIDAKMIADLEDMN